MRVVLDQGTPVPLRYALGQHSVSTAYELGWSNLDNGESLRAAEMQFEVVVTTDKNLRFQQNLSGRRLAFIVLPTTNWLEIKRHQAQIAEVVDQIKPGEYRELKW
ncbi:MAG: hypothetical protein NZ483_10770 [Verrucomicrobiae bacterium]|nr:hypothetical protein [Verrucomicrobiae bacterium]